MGKPSTMAILYGSLDNPPLLESIYLPNSGRTLFKSHLLLSIDEGGKEDWMYYHVWFKADGTVGSTVTVEGDVYGD